ncbi:MAG: DNA polymerase III subunit gamma/tau, partial [Veillonella sp.]|nr:DNA polymerase III subunit gamma/tau [Veillonella sp.]
ERSERNDLLNRMAQLEQRGPAAPTPAYGANAFGSPSSYANSFVSVDNAAVQNTSMSSIQNTAVGTVPPPSSVGMTPPPASVGMTPPPMGAPGSTPPPMNGVGMAPPPMGGVGMAPPPDNGDPVSRKNTRNQAKGRGKKGISTQAIISDQILSAQEYRNVQSNVIKYLKDSNRNMTSTVIGQGQLVYVDQSKAVMAFKNALHLGYAVHVEIVDALTQVYKDYKKAAGSTTQRQVKEPQRPQEPMVDVKTTSGAEPTQMDLTNNPQESKPDSAAVDAAKAAAMAFLAKKTGGAVANTVVSDSANTTTIDASETALGAGVETEPAFGGDVPITSFDDVPVDDMEGSYVSSLDDMPPHPLDSVTVISEDGEVLERPMDSGAHIEVEAVPKSDGGEPREETPHQSNDKAMLSSAPIEVEAIDSVTVAREYAWDPEHMTEEERNNPLLAETLEKLSEDHDIIVEVIEE